MATPHHQEGASTRHLGWRAAAVVATVSTLAVLGGTERHILRASLAALAHPHWGWLATTVAAEVVSMAALARMQRHLLSAGGVHMSARSAAAVVYASNAISGTVPVAGPEMATAFSYRRYQRLGADGVTTAWMLVVSGVVSSVTFAVVVAMSAVISGNRDAVLAGASSTVVLAAVLVGLVAGWHRPRSQARIREVAVAALHAWRRTAARDSRATRVHASADVDAAVRRVAAYRLDKGDWAWVVGAGLVNWVADAACLALALRVVGAHVPWSSVGLVWAAGAGASTLRVTPGGIGTVEPAMVAALAAAGLGPAVALTAVLAYRLVSFWGMISVGWSVQVVGQLRHRAGVVQSGVKQAGLAQRRPAQSGLVQMGLPHPGAAQAAGAGR